MVSILVECNINHPEAPMSGETSHCTVMRADRYSTRPAAEAAERDRRINRALQGGQAADYVIHHCKHCQGWHLISKGKLDRMHADARRGVGPLVRRGRGR